MFSLYIVHRINKLFPELQFIRYSGLYADNGIFSSFEPYFINFATLKSEVIQFNYV